MENLIINTNDLPSSGLMTEELFYLKSDKASFIQTKPDLNTAVNAESGEANAESPPETFAVSAMANAESGAAKSKSSAANAESGEANAESPSSLAESGEANAESPSSLAESALASIDFRKLQTKGFYKKPLLFLSPGGQHAPSEAEYNLLENILKALNLSIDDIALVEIAGEQPLSLELLVKDYRPKLIISFGAEQYLENWPAASELNVPLKHEQVLFLKAASLKNLEGDKTAKGALWNSLKILFKI